MSDKLEIINLCLDIVERNTAALDAVTSRFVNNILSEQSKTDSTKETAGLISGIKPCFDKIESLLPAATDDLRQRYKALQAEWHETVRKVNNFL